MAGGKGVGEPAPRALDLHEKTPLGGGVLPARTITRL